MSDGKVSASWDSLKSTLKHFFFQYGRKVMNFDSWQICQTLKGPKRQFPQKKKIFWTKRHSYVPLQVKLKIIKVCRIAQVITQSTYTVLQ